MGDDLCKVYGAISKEFDQTRYKPWPYVSNFIKSLDPGSNLLDVGCGNGKNMMIRKDINSIGCDFCPEFIQICQNKGLLVQEADCRNLPYADNSFDAVICIAVIHHLDKPEDRTKAVDEIIRVTRPDGRILIQVWADSVSTDHRKFRPLDQKGDYKVSWTSKNGTIYDRFYHLFEKNEAIDLVSNHNVKLDTISSEADNWCLTIKKNS